MKTTGTENKIKKIMIFAGEASGDLQGAALAKELLHYFPDAVISGVGGVRMREMGIDLFLDSTTFGVIGAWEGLKKLPTLFGLMGKIKKRLRLTEPDLVIFIDTPAFNVRLARVAKEMGIKSVYYFPPSAWSGSTERAIEISGIVDLVVNTFEYAAKTYEKAEIKNTFFTGHPLVDFMQEWKVKDRSEICKILDVAPCYKYIALLPGSRTQEINHVLPLLIESAEELSRRVGEEYKFLMPVASPLLEEKIRENVVKSNVNIKLTDGKSHAVMAASELIILASGSAALEACILEKPMILTYRLNEFDYKIIKMFVKLKWAGLPNLILQKEVVPELLQENATVENICERSQGLLQNEQKRQEMISGLREVNISLGEPGMIKRIAKKIWECVV